MIPKIIHNIWLDGHHNLPVSIQKHQMNVKKLNPDWEFTIWDEHMIHLLLEKYPKLQVKYNNAKDPLVKQDIAKYLILKENGGLYYDIEYVCTASFDKIFDTDEKHKDPIFITNQSSFFGWNHTYCSSFMAISKNHSVWDNVLYKVEKSIRDYHITGALNDVLKNTHYEIILLDKVSGPTSCSTSHSFCFVPRKRNISIFARISCYYKQIFLILLAGFIIFIVHYIAHHNSKLFAPVQLPIGMGGPAPPSHPASVPSKEKKEKKK
jgi:hypothetical protein